MYFKRFKLECILQMPFWDIHSGSSVVRSFVFYKLNNISQHVYGEIAPGILGETTKFSS